VLSRGLALHTGLVSGFALLICAALSEPATARANAFGSPEPVAVLDLPIGAGGTPLSTEEPYVSRDGRFLFFNSGEAEGNKDLHYAEATPRGWEYRGALGPDINTRKEVEGNPTVDRAGTFYFVDGGAPAMIRAGRFFADGRLLDVARVHEAPKRKVELFAQRVSGNMGVEVSADGSTLYFDRATWRLAGIKVRSILACDILLMTRTATGFVFDEAHARRLLANVNGPDIDYAESISADDLELFFTRLAPADVESGNVRSRIMRAVRPSRDAPFEAPEMVASIGDRDFVEGPALTDDGRTLYYHKRVGQKFRLFRVRR
jgi:hypothetical protein